MQGHDSTAADAGGEGSRLSAEKREPGELPVRARALQFLREAGIPFLVGGTYAYAHHTGLHRDTKDLDLFLRKADADRALAVFETNGWRIERDAHGWRHKAFWEDSVVDLIYTSANGVAVVDDAWVEHSTEGEVLGERCRMAPVEELIWHKAFVLERDRFDGTEVNHLLLATGKQLDWKRLLKRFDRYWEVLLSHLLMFRFAYPSDRDTIPDWVMWGLLAKAFDSVRGGNWSGKLCRGRILSELGYRADVEERGYEDGLTWDKQERDRHAPPPETESPQH